jgi:YidC/Oxa1 family membrane protein insertase
MFDAVILHPIFNLLIFIYSLIPGGDFGVALIIFTIIVRLLMWPLLKKQLHQVRAMQKMQPELVKIKKEARGDKRAEGMMMMELYKKHDISPFRAIGILLIQLPIFIALYHVIQIFTSHRDEIAGITYEFLKGLDPIKELIANPDTLNTTMFGFLDITKHAIGSDLNTVNVILLGLAFVAAITQYVLSKQTAPKTQSNKKFRDIMAEAAEGKQADQGEMNAIVMSKMVKFLPIMMFFIMIYLPGALVLYFVTSNLVAIIQQNQILKQDTQEMIEIADDATSTSNNKKATAKARAKQAQEATITRIVAKDDGPRRNKKKER